MAETKNEREDQTYRSSEVDDQEWSFTEAGNPDEPTLPDGEVDFGSVNESEDSEVDMAEQMSRQSQVRAYDAEGNPLTREDEIELGSEDVVEGDEVSDDEKDAKSGDDEDADTAASSGPSA